MWGEVLRRVVHLESIDQFTNQSIILDTMHSLLLIHLYLLFLFNSSPLSDAGR